MNDNNLTFNPRVKHDSGVAQSYGRRKLKKHLAEMELIKRGISRLDQSIEKVLDAPCGIGRATILLASEGYEATGLDLGQGAVDLARKEVTAAGVEAQIIQGDLLSMDFPDNHFDGVLCFRVYHHFPSDILREKLVIELCRVAKKHVLISYFSPYSATSIKRKIRKSCGFKASKQHATSLSSIEQKFHKQGFQLSSDIPQFRFLHTLHLAIFSRI